MCKTESKTETIYCFECGEELKDLETMYRMGGGEYICEDCCNQYYDYCEDCNDLVHNYDMIAVNNNTRDVCESCPDDYYVCDHCDNLLTVILPPTLIKRHYATIATVSITLCRMTMFTIKTWRIHRWPDYCSTCADDHRICILSYSANLVQCFWRRCRLLWSEAEIDNAL